MNKVFFGKANTIDVVTRCSYIREDKEWFNGIDVGDYIFIKVQGENTSEGAVVNYLFRAKSWGTVTEGFELKLEKIADLNNSLPLQKFIALDIFCLNTNLLNFTFKHTKGCIAPLEVVKDAVNVLETQEKWEEYYATEPVRKICVLDEIDKANSGSKDIQIIVDKRTVQLYRSEFIPVETYEKFDKNALLRIAPKNGSSKKKMYDALQNGDQEYSWKELSLLAFYDFFITQVETKRKDFIEYCKVHGVPTAYNQYESAIRTMEKLLSVNADEEYESDTCENMLNRAKTLPEAKTQDFPSKLKKFIEYKNAVYNNDAQENGSQKGATLMTVENNTENNISINTILYGPPGTGKTYNTVLYAVAICDEHTSLEELKDKAKSKDGYNEILAKYNKLISEDRIAFTTFHQSYGYEDFIEGIKPKIINDNVTYKVDSGIFKRFCENFDNSNLDNIFQKFELNDYPTVWKATLGESGENSIRTDCLENGHIRVGFDFYGPEISSDTDFSIDGGNRVLSNFINDMKIGDVILSCYDTRHIDAIGIVTGDYEWQESYPDHKRLRQVDWIVKDVKIDIVDLNGGRRMMPPTLYKMKVSLEDVKNLVFENITSSFSESKNKVFIIDEINRGNVSKIFGELITLIEEEKRDKSKVVLPYSAKEFTVPKNVYILGTMNTADRSLALMDTALRRRFDFVEMMPDADIFTENNSDIMVEDVSVKRLLEIMNKRIEFLYDREHTIGHAYFKDFLDKENRNIETLRRIFIKKIIPLLQEYFYDDYERIRLVLGDNQIKDNDMCFIKENEKMTNVFFGKTDIDMEAKTYTVNEKIKTFGAKRFVEIYEASDKGE